jgi:hypothetical protein
MIGIRLRVEVGSIESAAVAKRNSYAKAYWRAESSA